MPGKSHSRQPAVNMPIYQTATFYTTRLSPMCDHERNSNMFLHVWIRHCHGSEAHRSFGTSCAVLKQAIIYMLIYWLGKHRTSGRKSICPLDWPLCLRASILFFKSAYFARGCIHESKRKSMERCGIRDTGCAREVEYVLNTHARLNLYRDALIQT